MDLFSDAFGERGFFVGDMLIYYGVIKLGRYSIFFGRGFYITNVRYIVLV